ncbi:monovalent cation/H+ antiporter complex subunit F [Caenispirillum salinarum]|uniref:monovalent cation/H+ antiporter complex subunit F n=1 Tax=Caenispirillum salinarum TaxID=859058 RepID=UPI00384F91E6
MFIAAAAAILVTIAMAITRAVKGPSVWDRILAANMVGTKTVLLIAVLGFLTNRPEWGDIALAYTLINFVGVIAVLKFFRYRSLGGPASGIDDVGEV